VAANEGSGHERDIKVTLTAGLTLSKDELGTCFLISGTKGLAGTITLKGFVDNGVTGPIDETEGASPAPTKPPSTTRVRGSASGGNSYDAPPRLRRGGVGSELAPE
jgi:hypothetical protein